MNFSRIRLAGPVREALSPSDFRLETVPLRAVREHEVLTRTLALSLDPFLVRRMRDWSLDPAWAEGVISGRTIGQVLQSRAPDVREGDLVIGFGAWAEYDLRPAAGLAVMQDLDLPLAAHLGPLGSSGMTAWTGVRLIDPAPGETFCVSSAAGAVGSVAGSLARLRGARVVGIAGGPQKCALLRQRLAFDAAIDHRAGDLASALAAAAPGGIHGHFENVGAPILDPVLRNMAAGGRIGLCGLIAHYQDESAVALANFRLLLDRALTLRGFKGADTAVHHAQARREIAGHLRTGAIPLICSLHQGLEAAPAAFVDMLAGRGEGKHVVLL
jgi:NADPH-dependent curcumin reductase CurA